MPFVSPFIAFLCHVENKREAEGLVIVKAEKRQSEGHGNKITTSETLVAPLCKLFA